MRSRTHIARAAGAAALGLSFLTVLACSSGGSSGASSAAGAEGASGGATAPDTGDPITHNVSAADIAAAKSTAPIAGDRATLYVNGLGCPLCASNIDKQLVRVKGVESVAVDLSNGKVGVEFKPGGARPSPARLGEAVEDAGFTLVKVESGASAAGGAQ